MLYGNFVEKGYPGGFAAGIPFSSPFLRSVPPEGRFLRKYDNKM